MFCGKASIDIRGVFSASEISASHLVSPGLDGWENSGKMNVSETGAHSQPVRERSASNGAQTWSPYFKRTQSLLFAFHTAALIWRTPRRGSQ